MTIEAITFDFFNTLVRHRTGEGRGRALTAYLRDHGFDCDPWEHAVLYDVFDRHHLDYAPDAAAHEKQRYRARLAERVLDRLGVRVPVTVAADHADALWHILGPDSFSVYPEVLETLRVLKAAGYRLAVVSNWQCGLAHYCVELGIRGPFDHVVVSAEVGCAKPDPKIFREACSLLDKTPDRVLHVGDTFAEDVEGARAAGVHAVLHCRRRSPDCDNSQPDRSPGVSRDAEHGLTADMKLVVFDIDGTLVQANSLEDDCYISALRDEFGFDGVTPDWSSYQNVTDSGLLAEIFESRASHPPTRNEIRRFRQRYEARLIAALDEHPDEGREIPGSAAFMSTLLEHPGWAIAIATGNWRRLAVHKLKRARISGTGWPMACAEDALAREGLLELAITRSKKHYGVAAFDVIVAVGDASWDARAAAALGLPFVGVGPRWFADGNGPCAARILDYENPQAVTNVLTAIARA